MDQPYRLDGVVAKLSPAAGISLAFGPGRRGQEAGGSIIFSAGSAIRTQDLFAAFWRDEMPGMNWFADFLRDAEIDGMFFRLANPLDEEEEQEVLYSKAQLATVGSDVIDVF